MTTGHPVSDCDEAVDRRLADLATFAKGLAHDIRNPLSVIRTNLYLLRHRLAGEDPRALRALDRIDDQVVAALHLLEGVEAFSRADQPSLQRVQVNEVARAVVCSTVVPDGCHLGLELEETLPLVTADPQLLEAALRALLNNAFKALGGEGVVGIRTECARDLVLLAVHDSGPPIPEEVLRQAFEPLFTTHRTRAGLGLTLVAKIARAHGGRACLQSLAGHGTRAVLELPVHGT